MHTDDRHDWRHTPLSRMRKQPGDPRSGKVGGVIAGIARSYGFDLRTTRIAFAVAALILPVLAAIYVVAWLVLPETPAEAQSLDQLLHDRSRYPLFAVVALIVVVGVLGSFGSWFLYSGAPWGFVLIGLGILLWMSTGERFAMRQRTAGAGAGGPSPAGTAATTTAPMTATAMATPATTVPLPSPSPAGDPGVGFPPPTPGPVAGPPPDDTDELPLTPAPTGATPLAGATTVGTTTVATTISAVTAPRRRTRVPITSIGAGVMVLWFALVGIGNALDWWTVANLWVVVTGLGIVLTAMLISIVVNRSWVLPFLFFPLLFVLVMLCVTKPDIDGPSGQRTVQPTTVAEATTRQHLATGQLTIDLREVPLGDGPVAIDAEVGLGRLHVVVPQDVVLELHTDAGAGQVQLGERELSSGVRQQTTLTDRPSGTTSGTLELDLRVGMGQIDVERIGG
ncbi:MAG: PspC domain-containing protein [Ilumatobacteraceae bacterium]